MNTTQLQLLQSTLAKYKEQLANVTLEQYYLKVKKVQILNDVLRVKNEIDILNKRK